MADSKVTTAPFHRASLGNLAEAIRALIAERAGHITLAEAIGVLEIVKIELWQEHAHD